MDPDKRRFSILSRFHSFKAAFNGILIVLKYEHNAWLHCFAACIAIALGFLFHISTFEWLIVILCIGLVLSLECLNSSIEKLVDLVSPEKRPEAKHIKDMSAGAVLVIAIAALSAGLLIFIPKVFALFKQ